MLINKQIQKSQKIQIDYSPWGDRKEREIKGLLLTLPSTKAPGLDGFIGELYQSPTE